MTEDQDAGAEPRAVPPKCPPATLVPYTWISIPVHDAPTGKVLSAIGKSV